MRGQSSDTRRKGRRSNPGISRTNYRVQCGLDAWAVESLLPPCLEILGLCGHVISICRGMTQSNDTYVISPPKLFTKPSATTMTPQQNIMKGTVITWLDALSTGFRGMTPTPLRWTDSLQREIPARDVVSEPTGRSRAQSLRGNFEECVGNLYEVSHTRRSTQIAERTSRIAAQRLYLKPVKWRSPTSPAIFAFPKRRRLYSVYLNRYSNKHTYTRPIAAPKTHKLRHRARASDTYRKDSR